MNRLFSRETTFADYFSVFYKRKWMILIIFVAIIIITLIWSFSVTPVYQASAKIWFEKNPSKLLPTQYFYYWNPNELITEQEIIRSTTLAYLCVGKLKRGYTTEPAIWKDKFITDLRFYKDVIPGKYTIKFFKDNKFVIFSPEDKLLRSGRIGEEVSIKGIDLTITKPSVVAGEEFKLIIKNVHSLASQLMSKLTVRSETENNMLLIMLKGNNPEQISRETNTYAEEYIRYSYKLEEQQAKETTEFIDDQIDRVEEDLLEIENEIKKFKEKEGILEISQTSKDTISEISNLESQKTNSEIELFSLNSEYSRILNNLDDYSSVISSPHLKSGMLTDIQNRIDELYMERVSLLQFYTEKHPKVKDIDAKIEELELELQDRMEGVYEFGEMGTQRRKLQNEISKIDEELKGLDKRLEELPEKELLLTRLNRQANAKIEVYNLLLKKYQESKIAESMHSKTLNIVDFSTPPKNPISPNHKRNIIFGTILGLLLGIISAIVIEAFDMTINTPDEVKNFTDIPLVGIIPKWMNNKRRFNILEILRLKKPTISKRINRDAYLKTGLDPKSSIAEAFRTIRTNIKALSVDEEIQSIMISSSTIQEGKSTISSNLAIAFSLAGKKTLLIDADLRRSVIHKAYQVKRSPGITDICIDKIGKDDAIQKTQFENLSIIPSGKSIPNPAEILESTIFESLVSELKKEYELIIFDVPPILAVTDPLIVAKYSNINLLVIRSEVSVANSVNLALDNFKTANVTIDGIILNDIDLIRQYGSYGYRYYYYYEED